MTDIDKPILQEPDIITPKRRLSTIWLLPLIALMIGLWLAWRAFMEGGVIITVQFPDAEGLEPGKTQVVYNGLAVGKVKDLVLMPDLKGVNVHIEMSRQMMPYLTTTAEFWMVKPTVSMAGISGLDTLFSGNYIGFLPGKSTEKSKKVYVAEEEPPAIQDPDGLRITLRTSNLNSVTQGSPIYYRRLQVGEVIGYNLSADNQHVDIQVFVRPTYAHLVRMNTRFWNAGGVEVSGGLSSLKVRTQSVLSIIKGGIAFSTPDHEPEQPQGHNGALFTLYDDYDNARTGIPVEITFPTGVHLEEGRTKVMFMGFEIGMVESVDISDNLSQITARIYMDPRAEPALVEGTRFWVVEPQLSMEGVSGLDALLSGPYISMDVNLKDVEANKQRRTFVGLDKRPPVSPNAPGLHLTLEAPTLAGVSVGSPVLYRQIQIGSVQQYSLASDNSSIRINVFIRPEFAHLVNQDSRFWNLSGIHIKGDLSGLSINTGTLATLMNGGIGLATPSVKAPAVKNGHSFTLYDTEQAAMETGLMVRIRFDSGEGLKTGTPLKFRGMEVGEVKRVKLDHDIADPDHSTIIADTLIYNDNRWLAREGARFWLVKPELGLARTANLDTLIKGQYIQVDPADKVTPEKTEFIARNRPPAQGNGLTGLKVRLISDRLGSIAKGNPVYYREIQVGEVSGYRLGNPADHVIIFLTIDDHYAPLITPDTRFWNASGIDVDVGLFSGAKIRTESLESLLAGGIAFATPAAGTTPIKPGMRFTLHEKADPKWLEWKPAIKLAKRRKQGERNTSAHAQESEFIDTPDA